MKKWLKPNTWQIIDGACHPKPTEQSSLSSEQFERIDRITNFCDSIAFDFCFEQAAQGQVMIFPGHNSEAEIAAHYVIEAGEIRADPWPFSVETYSNYLIGYQLKDYPTGLDPMDRR